MGNVRRRKRISTPSSQLDIPTATTTTESTGDDELPVLLTIETFDTGMETTTRKVILRGNHVHYDSPIDPREEHSSFVEERHQPEREAARESFGDVARAHPPPRHHAPPPRTPAWHAVHHPRVAPIISFWPVGILMMAVLIIGFVSLFLCRVMDSSRPVYTRYAESPSPRLPTPPPPYPGSPTGATVYVNPLNGKVIYFYAPSAPISPRRSCSVSPAPENQDPPPPYPGTWGSNQQSAANVQQTNCSASTTNVRLPASPGPANVPPNVGPDSTTSSVPTHASSTKLKPAVQPGSTNIPQIIGSGPIALQTTSYTVSTQATVNIIRPTLTPGSTNTRPNKSSPDPTGSKPSLRTVPTQTSSTNLNNTIPLGSTNLQLIDNPDSTILPQTAVTHDNSSDSTNALAEMATSVSIPPTAPTASTSSTAQMEKSITEQYTTTDSASHGKTAIFIESKIIPDNTVCPHSRAVTDSVTSLNACLDSRASSESSSVDSLSASSD